jgi:hypothetical protein
MPCTVFSVWSGALARKGSTSPWSDVDADPSSSSSSHGSKSGSSFEYLRERGEARRGEQKGRVRRRGGMWRKGGWERMGNRG